MMIECVEGMVVKDRRKLFHISIDGYRHATRGIGYRLRKEELRQRTTEEVHDRDMGKKGNELERR